MRYLLWGLSFLVISGSCPDAGAQINFPVLNRADSLVCVFLSKTFGYWNGEKVYTGIVDPASDPDSAINLEVDSIDLIRETAVLRSEWGDEDVSIINTSKGLTFMHQSSSGDLWILTVYPYYDPTRETFSSVLSEHTGWSGSGLPSQAYGFCAVK